MSRLRVTTPAKPGERSPSYEDSLYMIRDSVERRKKLIHGRLHDYNGEHCAIGSFFDDNPKLALNVDLIDEVAAYNDSIPKSARPTTRRNKVLAWLNFKLRLLPQRAA